MENLTLRRKSSLKLPIQPSDCLYLWESDYNDAVSVEFLTKSWSVQRIDSKNQVIEKCKGTALNLSSGLPVIETTYLDEGSLVVALADGHLLRLTSLEDELEVIGSILGGLVVFSPCPNEKNLIVAVTAEAEHPALLLIRLFPHHDTLSTEEDSIVNIELEVTSFENVQVTAAEGVSVGWGRKETQFHGKAGKQAALACAEVCESRHEADDGRIRVSWSPDGEFFALNLLVDSTNCHREIFIFTKKGQVVARKEPTAGLMGVMAWRPDGSLIATHQISPSDGTHKILFYERNGLRHGEYTLDNIPNGTNHTGKPIGIIEDLLWNADGSILAIKWTDGHVDLWLCRNYHWYHKQRLAFSKGGIQRIFWSVRQSGRLFVLLTDGILQVFDYGLGFARSEGNDTDALSLVAVIDGSKVQLTPFAIANIPPPMSLQSLSLNFIPRAVAIAQGQLFVTNGCQLTSYSYNTSGRSLTLVEESTQDLPDIILNIIKWNNGTLFALLDDGRYISIDQTTILPSDTVPYADYFEYLPGNRLVTLTNGILKVDDITISRTVTSFLIHPLFLCTSDPEGNIRFYPLKLPISQWSALTDTRTEESFRPTEEKGALLVMTVPSSGALILQIPRGNLETIYPRAFQVAQVKKLLDGLKYKEAFLACRRHRLDLNILHDHNPGLFMATLGKFVNLLGSDSKGVEYLNLFISSLKNEDVIHSRYGSFSSSVTPSTSSLHHSQAKFDLSTTKVNRICRALRQELESLSKFQYAECIISTLVCQEPADLEGALQLIADLAPVNPGGVEKTLKYLLFLVPGEKLYPVALGMYNLPLALSIAKRSPTLDPADYLPLLEALSQERNLSRRHFYIDDHLQRYDRAWKQLYEAEKLQSDAEDHFLKVLDYIRRHGLYQSAFTFFASAGGDCTKEFKRICVAFGQNEISQGDARYHQRSAVDLFILAGEMEMAREEAVRGGYWQKAPQLLAGLKSRPQRREEWIMSMITTLKGQKRWKEAFYFAELQLGPNQLTALINLAIEGHLWLEGYRAVYQTLNQIDNSNANDEGSYESVVDAAMTPLIEAATIAFHEMIDEIINWEGEFEEKGRRLEIVQGQLVTELDPENIRQALSQSSFLTTELDTTDPTAPLSQLSLRTSSTVLTNTTLASLSRVTASKSKRKADKQRMRGKPGSPFEREYLRDTLRDIIDKVQMTLEGGGIDLIQFLADTGKWEEARSLQYRLQSLMERIEVWCGKLQRLIQQQEERMGPEVMGALGLTPWSIPPTLQVDHRWKTAFDLPPRWAKNFGLPYLENRHNGD